MFSNDYDDKFGATYNSSVYTKAQVTNKWTYTYTLLYALSKNGMKYATDKSGKCSLINKTSIGCKSSIECKPTDINGSLVVTFKQLCLVIKVAENEAKDGAYPTGIFVADTSGKTLATLCKYTTTNVGNSLKMVDDTALYGSAFAGIMGWKNDEDTDEDRFRVQTATFKDAKTSFDCVSVHLWAFETYLGAITFFKAKDYFSSTYKYGFTMVKFDGTRVSKFADGSSCTLKEVFNDGGIFHTKIAKLMTFCGSSFTGVVGGVNGVYRITDGSSIMSALPETKITIGGMKFHAISPGLFARTS